MEGTKGEVSSSSIDGMKTIRVYPRPTEARMMTAIPMYMKSRPSPARRANSMGCLMTTWKALIIELQKFFPVRPI